MESNVGVGSVNRSRDQAAHMRDVAVIQTRWLVGFAPHLYGTAAGPSAAMA